MDIVSFCPMQASGFEWRSRTGSHALTVVVKATFLLKPGAAVLAPDQEPVNEEERCWDEDPRQSVYAPSDWAPYKVRADVVLVGHAHAPGAQPVRSLVARMVVGEIDKSVEVWWNRRFRIHDNQLQEGPRFSRMPLRWELSAGGPGTNNPMGIPFGAAPDRYGMVAVPNLQPMGMYVSQRSDTFAPVGFGPIGARWPGRIQKLGRHVCEFSEGRWQKMPLPEDLDHSYFNAAPPDQQVEAIRANERIVLENLHPEHARLVTSLPGLEPRAIVDRATGEREEVQLAADTLWIDTDRAICTVVWRGAIGLRHEAEAGRVAVWADELPMVAPAENEAALEPGVTLVGTTVKNGQDALPFVAGMSSLAGSKLQIAADTARRAATAGDCGDGSGTIFAPHSAPLKAALPFGPQGAGDTAVQRTIPPLPRAEMMPATPFMADVPPVQPWQVEDSASPGEAPAGLPVPASVAAAELDVSPEVEHERMEVEPPPMIGPIAVAEKTGQAEEKKSGEEAAAREGEAQLQQEQGPQEFPLERCAAITASIARRKTDKMRILEEEQLSVERWGDIEKYWADTIRDDTKKGRKALLDRFDMAYVERLEQERGPITGEVYATLMVAAERGCVDDVLRNLGLPRGAAMRIERVWMGRISREPTLGEMVDAAMDDKRARWSLESAQ